MPLSRMFWRTDSKWARCFSKVMLERRRSSERPARAEARLDKVLRLVGPGGAEVRAVPVDLRAGAERDDAEEHELRERAAVLEAGARGRAALRRIDPGAVVRLHPGQGLRGLLVLLHAGFGEKARALAPAAAEELPLLADEEDAVLVEP